MALRRWFSHYSVAGCFLLLEEHKVNRRLKLLRDVDVFSLSVGDEVAAASRIRDLVGLFLHVYRLRWYILLWTFFKIMGVVKLCVIDLQFLERHLHSLLLFLLLRKALANCLAEMINKGLGTLVFCSEGVFFLNGLWFWLGCKSNGVAVELKKHFLLFRVSYSNSC